MVVVLLIEDIYLFSKSILISLAGRIIHVPTYKGGITALPGSSGV